MEDEEELGEDDEEDEDDEDEDDLQALWEDEDVNKTASPCAESDTFSSSARSKACNTSHRVAADGISRSATADSTLMTTRTALSIAERFTARPAPELAGEDTTSSSEAPCGTLYGATKS